MKRSPEITLKKTSPEAYATFTSELQRAFTIAVKRENPEFEGVVPDTASVNESLYAETSEVYDVLADGTAAGGAIVSVNGDKGNLELFFVKPEFRSLGIGQRAWQAIEQAYHDVRIWHTITPYFEKRNLHFYINKCGFRVVEYFNEKHVDPDYAPPDSEKDLPCLKDYFLFEKILP